MHQSGRPSRSGNSNIGKGGGEMLSAGNCSNYAGSGRPIAFEMRFGRDEDGECGGHNPMDLSWPTSGTIAAGRIRDVGGWHIAGCGRREDGHPTI